MNVSEIYKTWKTKYVKSHKDSYLYVESKDTHNTSNVVCVSEAMGYGMLATLLNDTQETFDKMFAFYKLFLNYNFLMSWRVSKSSNGDLIVNFTDKPSATDADFDACYALILAYNKYKNEEYKTHALKLCDSLMKKCIHPDFFYPLLGDWVSTSSKYYLSTRTSDFMLGHFKMFSSFDNVNSDKWNKVLDSCINILINLDEKLPPDFVVFEGGKYMRAQPGFLEGDNDCNYSWNSCRVPWRLGAYYIQYKDQRIYNLLDKYNKFFKLRAEQDKGVRAGYNSVSGEPLVDYTSLAFSVPVMVNSTIFNDRAFFDGYIKADMSSSNEYYADSVCLISMSNLEYLTNKPPTSIFPPILQQWVEGTKYSIGVKVLYKYHEYECLINNISHEILPPPMLPVVWRKVKEHGQIPPSVKDSEEWRAGNIYNKDKEICYNGKIYKCLVTHFSDTLTYPGKYNFIWEEKNIEPEINNWALNNNYVVGDKVIFENKVYESLHNHPSLFKRWNPKTTIGKLWKEVAISTTLSFVSKRNDGGLKFSK